MKHLESLAAGKSQTPIFNIPGTMENSTPWSTTLNYGGIKMPYDWKEKEIDYRGNRQKKLICSDIQ
jgi:hypothetical protein